MAQGLETACCDSFFAPTTTNLLPTLSILVPTPDLGNTLDCGVYRVGGT